MFPHEIRQKYSKRHPSTTNLLQFLSDSHLHPDLKTIVKPIRELAFWNVDTLPDGPELSAGLRHLIDAKDCFVRQYLVSVNFMFQPQRPESLADAPINVQE